MATEFMHQPWGGEHRAYRREVTWLRGDDVVVEVIDWCDACGMEVYPAIVTFEPGIYIRLDGLD